MVKYAPRKVYIRESGGYVEWFSPPVCGFCYAMKAAFPGVKDKCIGYPLRAVKKALIYGLLS